jgi:putative glutamine amidotransferase
VPDEYGTSVCHRGDDKFQMHTVTIEPRSRLSQMLGTTKVDAPCWHHQAVRKPAPGLVVVAKSADGVIEAVESAEHPELIAVQWHPEHTAATDAVQQKLFDHLIELLRVD